MVIPAPISRSETLLGVLEAALAAVEARAALAPYLADLPSPPGRRVILAAGKAAASMMRSTLEVLAAPDAALAISPPGYDLPPPAYAGPVRSLIAAHPTPDAAGLLAAQACLDLARDLGEDDQLLVLLSGGASSLLPAPVEGVTLGDKQALTRQLLACGAPISQINTVRRHLSRLKGGRLALAAWPAAVETLIVSDIPGDDPALVASGPTLGDPTTLADAAAVLHRWNVTPPASIAAALRDTANESPGPDDPRLARSRARIIARAADALAGAAQAAKAAGYEPVLLGDDLQGEARELGAAHADLAMMVAGQGRRAALISGGEVTATLCAQPGRGGPNLEYLAGMALRLGGAPAISALACDTDGVDGASGVAGGWIGPETLARAAAAGFDIAESLARNDVVAVFEAVGGLVDTGPTLTNVNDLRVILIDPD